MKCCPLFLQKQEQRTTMPCGLYLRIVPTYFLHITKRNKLIQDDTILLLKGKRTCTSCTSCTRHWLSACYAATDQTEPALEPALEPAPGGVWCAMLNDYPHPQHFNIIPRCGIIVTRHVLPKTRRVLPETRRVLVVSDDLCPEMLGAWGARSAGSFSLTLLYVTVKSLGPKCCHTFSL